MKRTCFVRFFFQGESFLVGKEANPNSEFSTFFRSQEWHPVCNVGVHSGGLEKQTHLSWGTQLMFGVIPSSQVFLCLF